MKSAVAKEKKVPMSTRPSMTWLPPKMITRATAMAPTNSINGLVSSRVRTPFMLIRKNSRLSRLNRSSSYGSLAWALMISMLLKVSARREAMSESFCWERCISRFIRRPSTASG